MILARQGLAFLDVFEEYFETDSTMNGVRKDVFSIIDDLLHDLRYLNLQSTAVPYYCQ